jgi:succinate-semialdehyde dehydrogenase/glutarate-semialdehyde dehydrogenase
MAPTLKDPSLFKQNVCLVNGEWVPASSGQTFEVHDPATGSLVGTAPEFTVADTDKAIAAAAAALPAFRALTGRERARILRRWFDLMMENVDDLAALITWENGKPLADARGEATYAAGFFEWFAEEAPRAYGDTIPASVASNRIATYKEPVGVCALVTPWNFPAAMITRKVGPALAAGCTVVVKSPAETPFASLAVAELGVRAGVPPGVINVVTADANTVDIGNLLTTSPTVKKVSFTGSTNVGKILMKQASSTLKKLSFELGGNAPLIVFDDANLDEAVSCAITSKFRSSGQTCVCANRLYVQKGILPAFLERFTAAVAKFSLGNGFAPDVTHGPLVYARAVDKAERHVQDAVGKGATLVRGGVRRPDLGPNFFEPAVLTGMTPDMVLASEEVFAPVAGLVSDVAGPFGGVKESGFGREGSKYGIAEYQTTKMVITGGMGKPLQK